MGLHCDVDVLLLSLECTVHASLGPSADCFQYHVRDTGSDPRWGWFGSGAETMCMHARGVNVATDYLNALSACVCPCESNESKVWWPGWSRLVMRMTLYCNLNNSSHKRRGTLFECMCARGKSTPDHGHMVHTYTTLNFN